MSLDRDVRPMGWTPACSASRTGFTLIELMVVIVIIAILASILLFALGGAPTAARNAVIATEIGGLATAIEEYKSKFGEYPPDFTDRAIVVRHLKSRFPYSLDDFSNTTTLPNLTPAQALVFWLSGFSTNEKYPITGTDKKPRFSFDQTRLLGTAPYFVYVPVSGQEAPYVYFERRTYAAAAGFSGGTGGTAKPYKSSINTSQYANAQSFQIISAGLDGDYGGGAGFYPAGTGYTVGDRDNLTNFSGKTLEDSMP